MREITFVVSPFHRNIWPSALVYKSLKPEVWNRTKERTPKREMLLFSWIIHNCTSSL